ncbi:alpha/beta hydrolase [Roseomonas populi]|uniref:Palmitoyl-protein thioesterase ABHD10, mitochondrial n=1 Tax=Roseomonas populi TaxID=3121582 RepID=A0ABT1X2G3_9PROT|nr:alpha/beta hydrolase [Roseomonas pecuniae]MCR0982281.1 alpha/beta hydrolase [Roseomonas pecuniae]
MNEIRGTLSRSDGVTLAWAALPGAGPTVVFLGGFRSDMEGSKALHLRDHCAAGGRAFLRLDYSGHGISGGEFEDGTIGTWTEDAALVIEARAPGPVVLVGSSMGGWIALLLARRWGAGRVRGVVGIAAAPDFTEALMPGEFTEADRAALERDGVIRRPSEYGEPIPITRRLLEDGRNHLLLPGPIPYEGPVRLLQGMADPDVPWRHALRIVEALPGPDTMLTLVKDSDHRLSRPQDLALLSRELEALPG